MELYEDGLIARWVALDCDVDTEEDLLPDPDILISDDVGTEYLDGGSHATGNLRSYRGDTQFVPGVPPTARRLTVAGGGWSFEFEL